MKFLKASPSMFNTVRQISGYQPKFLLKEAADEDEETTLQQFLFKSPELFNRCKQDLVIDCLLSNLRFSRSRTAKSLTLSDWEALITCCKEMSGNPPHHRVDFWYVQEERDNERVAGQELWVRLADSSTRFCKPILDTITKYVINTTPDAVHGRAQQSTLNCRQFLADEFQNASLADYCLILEGIDETWQASDISLADWKELLQLLFTLRNYEELEDCVGIPLGESSIERLRKTVQEASEIAWYQQAVYSTMNVQSFLKERNLPRPVAKLLIEWTTLDKNGPCALVTLTGWESCLKILRAIISGAIVETIQGKKQCEMEVLYDSDEWSWSDESNESEIFSVPDSDKSSDE